MKKKLLITLANENYINQAKQLFSSVYLNAGWDGDYMLLAHKIPEEKLSWFKEKNILIKKCNPLFKKELSSGYSNVVLNKFYIFTPEFKKWNNIIFLDSDIIVRHPLDELSNIRGFYAVPDFSNHLLKKQFKTLPKKFKPRSLAFNVGSFAFSTNLIKKETFSNLINLFNKYEKDILFPEQAILNLYFYKKWNKLNFLYNSSIAILNQKYHIKMNKIDGIVLHFCGKDKPWNKNNYFYSEWQENLKKSNQINFKNPIKVKKLSYLKKLKYLFKYNRVKISMDCYYFFDKQIGKIGILVKKFFPKIYYFIKK